MWKRIIVCIVVAMTGQSVLSKQTLHPEACTCLIAMQPKSCEDNFGPWPGASQTPFACADVVCAATTPPTCLNTSTWRENLDQTAWITEHPDYTVPMIPQTGLNRKNVDFVKCRSTTGCVSPCPFVPGSSTRPPGYFCGVGAVQRSVISLWAKCGNLPCQGIDPP
jgi:hypothetical protein